MANSSPYLTDQAVLSASPEVVGLERQRKLADLLTSQAFQSPQGQMISGHYVMPATTQQLQPLLGALLGSTLNKSLDEKQVQLAAALRGEKSSKIQQFAELQKTNPSEAMVFALNSGVPELAQIAQEKLKGLTLAPGAVHVSTDLGGNQIRQEGNPDLPETLKYAISVGQLPPNPATWTPQQAGLARQIIESKSRAGATNVSLSTEKSYGTNLADKFSTKDAALNDAAEAGVNSIRNIQNQKQILNSGKFFSGPTANVQQALASYGNALGVGGKDSNELAANTQSLISGGAKITLDNIKSSGLGAGQGFTDKDLQFLQDAQSYKIIWSKESIDRVLNLQEKAAKTNIDKWNTRLQDIPKSASAPLGIRPIQVPTYSNQPAGNQPTGNQMPARSNVVNEALSIIQGK